MQVEKHWEYDDGGRALAGFQGDTGDCGVRAIAIVTGMTYREVYDGINILAKEDAKGRTSKKRCSNSRTGIWPHIVTAFLEPHGWKWVPTMEFGKGCTVHLNAEELPDGAIIARVSRHFTAVVDGVIRDTYDPSREGKRCVYGYWVKEES